ncbi:hypothetical protein AB0M28_38125, partial [Streptomyces sp. NPDC051940]|uniref:hypothetical protein n=1 Tax=Streptomyces sp. NPDC051940 TaxID=3155675 RepID=UPI0034419D02
MLLRPKYPPPAVPTDALPVRARHASVPEVPGPSACACPHDSTPPARRNTVQLTPAGVIAAVGAGTAVVLVVGAVL